MKLQDDEVEQLAQELSIRSDFEHAATQTVEKAIRDAPRNVADVLKPWVSTLLKQENVIESAAFWFDESEKSIQFFTHKDEARDWWGFLLESEFRSRIDQSVRERQALCCPMFHPSHLGRSSEETLLIIPCTAPEPPAALAVAMTGGKTTLVQWMVDGAATRAGCFLAMLRADQARERGYREMAARVAHMTSGSILLAQFGLDSILKEESMDDKIRPKIENALQALAEAQQGLDRARLLGVPSTHYAEHIELGSFVRDMGSSLNKAVGQEIVSHETLESCAGGSRVFVEASAVRLRYALRDLTLGTWLLTEPRLPIRLSLIDDTNRARLCLYGNKTTLSSKTAKEVKIEQLLRDPAVFLLSPDQYKPERSIGFHLAWSLIEEMGGVIRPSLEPPEHLLNFVVELPSLENYYG